MELSLERFGELVAAAVEHLPQPLQPYLDRFEFDVSETPPAGEPELCVARESGPRGFERITVYKAPFEVADSETQLRDWLREALLEEITGEPADEESRG